MMPDDFEERLRAALRRESDRLPFVVTIADVEHRLAEPSRRFPRWLAIAAVPLGTALVAAVLLAAPRVGRVATNTTAIPEVIAGGCGSTQLFAPPGPTGLPSLEANPWARARPAEAGITAYLWGDPPYLAAGKVRPLGQGNKILWISDREPSGHLVIAAYPPDAASPEVRFDFPSALSPSGNYPSLIDLPSSGCWRLDLTIGTTKATIELLVAPPGPSPAPTATLRVVAAPPSCPITKRPNPPFVPPPSFLGTPLNGSGRAFYYGTNDLWTKVYADGSWGGARDASGGYGNKSFWWSVAFKVDEEPQPALQVTGRRLDAPAETARSGPATNAAASDIGSAMLTGLTLPTDGCWELTGHYRGHELSYVVWIPWIPGPSAAPTPLAAKSCPLSTISPTVDELGPRAELRTSEPPQIRNGAATLWVRVEPATDAPQQLLVTGFTVDGRISGTTNGQLVRAAVDQVPSDWPLPGTYFAGAVKFWQSGCWELRVVADGKVIGSAVVRTEARPEPLAGRFRTATAIPNGPCVALDLETIPNEAAEVPAWWWNEGNTGDCSSRTSDVVRATARFVPDASGYQIELERGLLNGGAEVIRMQLVPVGDELQGSVNSAGDAPVSLVRVQKIAPTFAPLP